MIPYFSYTESEAKVCILQIEQNFTDIPSFSMANTIEIDRVSSLKEALSQLSEKSYDAILLDPSLPDYEDLEVLNTVLGNALQKPIIVLSSSDDEDFSSQVLKAGAQCFLNKQKTNSDLIATTLSHVIDEGKPAIQHYKKYENIDEVVSVEYD